MKPDPHSQPGTAGRPASASAWFLATGLLLTLSVIALFPLVLVPPSERSTSTDDKLQLPDFVASLPNWITQLSVLVLIAGMIGAYIQLARDIFTSAVLDNEKGSLKRVTRPSLLALHLLVGGLSGFIAGLLIPTALLRTGKNLETFNPAALAILSAAVGMLAVRVLAGMVDRLEQLLVGARSASLSSETVEAGVRAALAPPPLTNYRGKLTCIVKGSAGSAFAAKEGVIFLPRLENEFTVEALLQPISQDGFSMGSSVDVVIDDGSGEASAPAEFILEFMADDFQVSKRTAKLVASASARSDPVTVQLTRQGDGELSPRAGLQLILNQSGRMVQVLSLALKDS